MKVSEIHKLFLNSKGISTDTRKISSGSIFFALKGPKFDANEFADKALNHGASYAVVDEPAYATTKKHILVQDSLKALQELATYHRNFLTIPILSLTGSNGKTTTKELINMVLSQKYQTVATQGNLNNHIGVPLTLLSMTKETEFGIVEMGANHHGEIALLSRIAQPDYGYITNFGKAHLEGFGSLEGVKKAKGELYDFLKQKNKLIFLNADDETQRKQLEYNHIFSFGKNRTADLTYSVNENVTEFVELQYKEQKISTKLTGSYNEANIAAAVAIGIFFNIPLNKIIEALGNYEPTNNRSQIIHSGSNKIILDAYNANPTSMEAALRSFGRNNAQEKTIILGDMFEMGNSAAEEHQNIVEIIKEIGFYRAYLIGENFYRTTTNQENIKTFRNKTELKEFLDLKKLKGTEILLKGSRGMALETLLED